MKTLETITIPRQLALELLAIIRQSEPRGLTYGQVDGPCTRLLAALQGIETRGLDENGMIRSDPPNHEELSRGKDPGSSGTRG